MSPVGDIAISPTNEERGKEATCYDVTWTKFFPKGDSDRCPPKSGGSIIAH